jgi:FMN phosphatase YigB (HAD superfamily)
MKFIFDFDDVLFHTTKHFKEHILIVMEKIGAPRNFVTEYLEKERWKLFSLKKLIARFANDNKEYVYEEIMGKNKNFINNELLILIKKLGKLNCYIVTYGEEEFQRDKIKRTGIDSLFSEIIVVSGSKKEAVEKICSKHRDEKVVFIDDKAKYFENLDFKRYPNLKTILYDEKGLEKLISILPNIY